MNSIKAGSKIEHIPYNLNFKAKFNDSSILISIMSWDYLNLSLANEYVGDIKISTQVIKLLLLVFSSYLRSTPNGIKFMYLKFCLTVQSHLHQIQYVHMAHGFPPPFCTGKKLYRMKMVK